MKRYKVITAAENTSAEDALKDSLNALEDDFDFLVAGIEKIGRGDAAAGQQLISMISESIQSAVSQLASELQEVE